MHYLFIVLIIYSEGIWSKWASMVVQTVKNLSACGKHMVRSLGQEDLEKGMATHSCIHAWRIAWTEEPGGLQSMGLQRVRKDWVTNKFLNKILFSKAPWVSITSMGWYYLFEMQLGSFISICISFCVTFLSMCFSYCKIIK